MIRLFERTTTAVCYIAGVLGVIITIYVTVIIPLIVE